MHCGHCQYERHHRAPALSRSDLQINDGEEVFVAMRGCVGMHYREACEEKIIRLETGDIFFSGIGTEHIAHPQGEARILVIEKEGSA